MARPEAAEPVPSASDSIARRIRELIMTGEIGAGDRLPGEQELATRFGVSRPTIREALKRLAAQNLIRTRRGAAGGSFVQRYGLGEAQDQIVSTATMLMSLNPVPPEAVTEARLGFLKAIAPLAASRRTEADLAALRAEIEVQMDGATTDEEFCASDVRFYRVLVDSADNPLISLQMAVVIEAIQPLLNMITYRARDRSEIARGHAEIADRLEARDADGLAAVLDRLSRYTGRLVAESQAGRQRQGSA